MNEKDVLPIVTPRFDIEREDLYKYATPELRKRTKKRLTEIAQCGMEETWHSFIWLQRSN